jgi:hypothetical protein
MSKLDRSAVHRGLKAFDVRLRIFDRLPARETIFLEKTIDNVLTKLEIVGKALLPGGILSRAGPEAGWATTRSPDYFKLKVSKA